MSCVRMVCVVCVLWGGGGTLCVVSNRRTGWSIVGENLPTRTVLVCPPLAPRPSSYTGVCPGGCRQAGSPGSRGARGSRARGGREGRCHFPRYWRCVVRAPPAPPRAAGSSAALARVCSPLPEPRSPFTPPFPCSVPCFTPPAVSCRRLCAVLRLRSPARSPAHGPGRHRRGRPRGARCRIVVVRVAATRARQAPGHPRVGVARHPGRPGAAEDHSVLAASGGTPPPATECACGLEALRVWGVRGVCACVSGVCMGRCVCVSVCVCVSCVSGVCVCGGGERSRGGYGYRKHARFLNFSRPPCPACACA